MSYYVVAQAGLKTLDHSFQGAGITCTYHGAWLVILNA